MRAALQSVPGVRVIDVKFSEQLAIVRYDESAATVADMVAALEALGYRAWDAATERRTPGKRHD